jgi:hypothetical protein
MDRSTFRLPDPDAQLPNGERRRTVRQKLHTPVYVSFNTPQSGTVVDLSELLDLDEHGFAVQTALPRLLHNPDLNTTDLNDADLNSTDQNNNHNDRLEVHRAVTMCLDLPETRKFVHASGQVMWTDDTGRAGIRFSFLTDTSRQVLKEWLFANLLVASTNYSARTSQLAHRQQELRANELFTATPAAAQDSTPDDPRAKAWPTKDWTTKDLTGEDLMVEDWTAKDAAAERLALEPEPGPAPVQTSPPAQESDTLDSARVQLLSALDLDDVRRQISEITAAAINGDIRATPDAILQLIAERAASLTGASGAALALLTGDKIVCRASLGEPAPPVGAEVDAGSGLSGECLRTGMVVSCADTEGDSRVDPETCRMFGIGSFMAAPIFADFRVVGLVEVFSPYPHTFSQFHEIVLERLAELVASAENRPADSQKADQEKIEARKIDPDNRVVVQAEIAVPEPTEHHQTEPKTEPKTEPADVKASSTRQTAAERNAILEQIFETSDRSPDRTSDRTSDRISDRISEQASNHSPEEDSGNAAETDPSSARHFPFSHLVLLVLTVAVAAMALGYLLAPTIEAHLLRRAQASAPASSLQNAAGQRHALSPAELRQSAEQGDPDAEWQLGILYHDGDGIPQNDTLAMQWFERAAEQGYVPAQATLGAYYWAGRGVPPDRSKAYFWSLLALAQGDKDSKSRLEGLSAEMTQAQVADARQQAEAWLHAHNQSANPKAN